MRFTKEQIKRVLFTLGVTADFRPRWYLVFLTSGNMSKSG